MPKGMNSQGTAGGIEWTRIVLPDGRVLPGYTWNPIGGCLHGCRWVMSDGSTAICYAESVAERLATHAYAEGFAHHYWRPDILGSPLKLKEPSGIFLDSMSDLWGRWVPAEQLQAVLDVVRCTPQHIYFSLTKNAPRLLKLEHAIPRNLWIGVSSPPDVMFGQSLDAHQQDKMLARSLSVLQRFPDHNTWMSFEPLSRDYAAIVSQHPGALDWAVIGAASNGPKVYDPDYGHVTGLLEVLDGQRVPIFYKGNLRHFCATHGAVPWREAFPAPREVAVAG